METLHVSSLPEQSHRSDNVDDVSISEYLRLLDGAVADPVADVEAFACIEGPCALVEETPVVALLPEDKFKRGRL